MLNPCEIEYNLGAAVVYATRVCMEKQQSPGRQPANHPAISLSSPEKSSSETTDSRWSPLDLFAQLIQRYPVTFWSGIWLGMVLVATVSVVGILTPSYVKQAEQRENAEASWNEEPSTNWQIDWGENASLWSFAAIAASCAAGSWFLYRQLNQSSSSSAEEKEDERTQPNDIYLQSALAPIPVRSLPAANHKTVRLQTAHPKTGRKPSTPTKVAPKPGQPTKLKPPLPAAQALVVQSPQTSAMVPEPQVTVVPEEESHPLDWSEASLAEMMDIRKRRSLSSLM
ncbi:MAG: hypothetical protein KME16_23695 [Scytolyngbya sp. HA4215-MV1]|jgi:hypothetical protein|nr:hypothetical protein [Scytolyngbya sp. HA4215-MV1]